MIKPELSRSGHAILRLDGRLLASSIDPIREAQTWAMKAGSTGSKGAICVIGAGCGYHIEELQKLLPNTPIVIAERSTEVAAWVLEKFPSIEASSVIVGENPSDELERWCEHFFAVSRVVLHGPTSQIHPEWTRAIQKFILARDRVSFLTQIRTRPELLAIIDPNKIESVPDEAVSIKTLRDLFVAGTPDSQERRMWRILEELIA